MAEQVYSFVYDAEAAEQEFPKIGMRNLVLAILAGVRPQGEFEGCLVYEGESPEGEGTVCIATSGPGADRLQQSIVEAFEGKNVPVTKVFEGGPGVREAIARAEGGVWKEAAS